MKYKIGDHVTIIKVPPDVTNNAEIKTIFKMCLNKTYPVQGFDQFGHLELLVGKDIDKKVGGYMNTIWIEPDFVIPAKHKKKL